MFIGWYAFMIKDGDGTSIFQYIIDGYLQGIFLWYTFILPGWWFGTFFIFPYIGNVIIPTDFHIFQRGRYTTNRYIHIYIYIHPLITPLDYMLSAKLKYQRIFRDPASERGRRIQIIIKARCSPWWRNCGCRNGEKHGIRQEQPTSIIKHKNQQHAFKMIVQDDSISKNI